MKAENPSIDQVRITDCLQIREAAFATVFETESIIREILGEEMPLPEPAVELPSTRKTTKPAKKKILKPKAALRRLKEGENAYRLTYLYNDVLHQELVRNLPLLKKMIDFEMQDFQLVRIETVFYHSPTQVDSCEMLYATTD